MQQKGREKRYALTPAPLAELDQFVQEIGARLDERLLRLKAFLEEEEEIHLQK